MKVFGYAVLAFFGIIVVSLVFTALGFIGGAVDNGVKVAQKEFYPDALLRKYEWFKDASAALDAKSATIEVYTKRFQALKAEYGTTPRSGWARDDREQYSIWASEVAGIKASYNLLSADYNSEMAKFNWRFTNVGDVPQGGKPLPREYRPYIEE